MQTGVPNVYLEHRRSTSIVEADLRLALNDALDKLILDAIATQRLPGTVNRPAARQHPQGDDDDPRRRATAPTR